MSTTAQKTLKDEMPREFSEGSYSDTPAWKLRDAIVKQKHDAYVTPWPGPQRNVNFWFELENGKAVGWNENPSRGWSFPVVAMPKTGA